MNYKFFLALRHMKSKGRKFLSFATFVSIVGIALGVAAIIVVMSVMNGFTEEIRGKILGLKPHIFIQKFNKFQEDPSFITDKISHIDGVVAASPVLWGEGIIQYQDRARGVMLKGIDYDKELEVTNLGEYVEKARTLFGSKRYTTESLEGSVLIGDELAKDLGVAYSDSLSSENLFATGGEVTLISPRMQKHKFNVKGFFNSGFFEYDNSLVFLSLEDAQKLLGVGGEYSGIQVKVENVFKAEDIKEKIQDALGSQYIVRTWQDMDRTLFEALKLEKIAMFTILTLIVIVASFNIASTLVVMVMEKRRQIGILKALGVTSADIRKIFFYQGAFMGFFGTALGCILGFVLGFLLRKYHFISLSEEIYTVSFLPVKMEPVVFVIVGVIAFLISIVATLYPAVRASKLSIAETLRYE